jgi:thioester reductase-like protein
MVGAHFVQHILATQQCQVHCIAVDVKGDEDPVSQVISTLSRWNLSSKLPQNAIDRLNAYKGSLSHGTLGLSESQTAFLDKNTDAIYHFDSDVSMMKNYGDIRAGNVGAMQFLIKFASSPTSGRVKSIHYLSTWGVPHLQSWSTTQLDAQGYLKGEEELTNMTPGQESSLGYLKCRWVSEAMLYKAAEQGLPVNIYRSCMAGTNKDSQQGLDRTDINRRIIESALETGLVPDFRSDKGGGMSWIELDFLVQSIGFLSHRAPVHDGHQHARIFNVVSDQHFLYSQLVDLLGVSHDGNKLCLVEPSKYLQALRATGNPEMMIHAEVIQSWYEVGWTPFQLQAEDTLRLLKTEANLQPPQVDREFIMTRVIGKRGF